jgi:integrase
MGKKRPNGEGMVRQRDDGRWEARITTAEGKPKSFYGKTQREAVGKRSDALLAQRQGRVLSEPSQTIASYLNRWLEDHVKPTVRPTTYESYALNVRRVVPHIGRYRIDNLSSNRIEHCYRKLLDADLSPASVQQVHRVLRAALRHAVGLGLIGRSPLDSVKPPRAERREMSPLTPAQVHGFLASAADDHLYPLWATILTTGLRVGEATGLVWSDIDLETGATMIHQTLHRQAGQGLVLGPTKTDRSRRPVYLPTGALSALRRLKAGQKEAGLRAGQPWTESRLVFATGDGRPLDPGYVLKALHRALEGAGLPKVRVHDLRHTAATYLLGTGTHPKIVQELLGHSSITLTMNTYSHVLPALHKQVAAQMQALFEPPDEAEASAS